VRTIVATDELVVIFIVVTVCTLRVFSSQYSRLCPSWILVAVLWTRCRIDCTLGDL